MGVPTCISRGCGVGGGLTFERLSSYTMSSHERLVEAKMMIFGFCSLSSREPMRERRRRGLSRSSTTVWDLGFRVEGLIKRGFWRF